MIDFKSAVEKRKRKQLLTWWILPLTAIGGWLYPILGYFIPVCMVAGVGIAKYRGRYWCDWMCPRGSFWDLIFARFKTSGKLPDFIKSWKFRIPVIVILMTVLITQIPRAWPSITGIGMVFVTMLTVTTVVGIVFGSFTHHRNWCTYCPVGSMSNLIGREKFPLQISSACTSCKKCDAVCPIQIKRWQYKPGEDWVNVPEWDCLKCGLCVNICPNNALRFKN